MASSPPPRPSALGPHTTLSLGLHAYLVCICTTSNDGHRPTGDLGDLISFTTELSQHVAANLNVAEIETTMGAGESKRCTAAYRRAMKPLLRWHAAYGSLGTPPPQGRVC